MINRVAFLVLVILLTVVGGGLSFGCFSSEEDIFYVWPTQSREYPDW